MSWGICRKSGGMSFDPLPVGAGRSGGCTGAGTSGGEEVWTSEGGGGGRGGSGVETAGVWAPISSLETNVLIFGPVEVGELVEHEPRKAAYQRLPDAHGQVLPTIANTVPTELPGLEGPGSRHHRLSPSEDCRHGQRPLRRFAPPSGRTDTMRKVCRCTSRDGPAARSFCQLDGQEFSVWTTLATLDGPLATG